MAKRDAMVIIHEMRRPWEDHNEQGGGQKNCSNNDARRKDYEEQDNGQKNSNNNNARQEDHEKTMTWAQWLPKVL